MLELALLAQQLRYWLEQIELRLLSLFKVLQMALLVKDQELAEVVSVLANVLEIRLLARASRASLQICDRVLLQVVQSSKLLSLLVI